MQVVFPRPGFSVRRCTWINRHADPLAGCGRVLPGTVSPLWTWRDPREETAGVSWEPPL